MEIAYWGGGGTGLYVYVVWDYQDEIWYDAEKFDGEEEYEDAYYVAEEDDYDDDGDTCYEDAHHGEEDHEQEGWCEPRAEESGNAVAEYDDVHNN